LQNPNEAVLKLLRLLSIEVLFQILMMFLKMNESTFLPKIAELANPKNWWPPQGILTKQKKFEEDRNNELAICFR
jgi:hypothetical protein